MLVFSEVQQNHYIPKKGKQQTGIISLALQLQICNIW